jgi:hypothetical protein
MKKNIHVLETNQPSRLIKNINGQLKLTIQTLLKDAEIGCYPQHIYITSSQKLKKGINTWYLDKFLNKIRNSNGAEYVFEQDVIMLTTDRYLIGYGIQDINDEFLEWFMKNPTCEFVELVAVDLGNGEIGSVIRKPQEEPKQETRAFGTKDDKSFWSDKPIQEGHTDIQETLPENAENFAKTRVDALKDKKEWNPDCIYHEAFNGYIVGSTETAKKMYSEADKIMKFLETEKQLKLSDAKTIERIKWYFETYFEQFLKALNQEF